ncbi:MAG TPA: DUF192 domain-containing protein [Longimicrobiales bacterium]|nr:DUF192 domain-containing protein [Longimicrobiales bacterium]
MHAAQRHTARALALAVAFAAAACGPGDAEPRADRPALSFERGRVLVLTGADTLELSVEVAETEAQRAQGLMERRTLAEDSGMVFLYDELQPGSAGFYMFRTRIPLDIAFFDAAGAIVRILAMEPCESPNPGVCRTYPPGVPYMGALEVNQGWFARHGVAVGDTIVVER